MTFLLKWGTKLAIVSGATVLVANHEVFGANKYTQQIIREIRTSLPDTAELFDQMPTRAEFNDSMIESWNSGAQSLFKGLADGPKHTRRFISWLGQKVNG